MSSATQRAHDAHDAAVRESAMAALSRGHHRTRPIGARSVGLLALAVLVLSAAGAVSAILTGTHRSQGSATLARPDSVHEAGSPGTSSHFLPASAAALMGISRPGNQVAPPFTLTDQRGQTVSLAQLERGHTVVLGFVNDQSADVGPVLAKELTGAAHDLGTAAAHVAFVLVNVNAAHGAVATLQSFLAVHGNGTSALANFYFLTGSSSALHSVWKDYGVTVEVQRTGVYSSQALYFISPGGRERYEATPYANLRKDGNGWLPASTVAGWSRGIASFAEKSA